MTNETYTERRSEGDRRKGRVIYSRGPIIRTLEVASAATALLAVAALVFALVSFSNRLDNIQESREKSATDTCNIITVLLHHAYTHPADAHLLLDRVGLENCQDYGKFIVRQK